MVTINAPLHPETEHLFNDKLIGMMKRGSYIVNTAREKICDRDAIVRATAAMIEAARYMNDPKNVDKVAEACMITGHSKEIAKAALKQFLDVKFWATKDDGLPRDKIEATAALMKKIGAITADKQPVTYDNLVDTSVWKDANAMVK